MMNHDHVYPLLRRFLDMHNLIFFQILFNAPNHLFVLMVQAVKPKKKLIN